MSLILVRPVGQGLDFLLIFLLDSLQLEVALEFLNLLAPSALLRPRIRGLLCLLRVAVGGPGRFPTVVGGGGDSDNSCGGAGIFVVDCGGGGGGGAVLVNVWHPRCSRLDLDGVCVDVSPALPLVVPNLGIGALESVPGEI